MSHASPFLRAFLALAVCLVPLAGVAGCSKEPLPVSLPEGVQVLTGTLLPTEISLLRRGTHLLNIDGTDVYLVESAEVPLSRYEHKEVVLEGTLSQNVDPSFLPVLEVQSVVRVLQESQREWALRSVGLSASLPDSWEGSIGDAAARFHPPTQPDPVITVELLPTAEVTVPTDGVPIVIDSKRSLRTDDEQTGAQVVYVERGAEVLLLSFTPSQEHFEDDRNVWLAFLRSISFSGATPSPALPTATGGQLGAPCGGPAGVLCPEGYYCEVTNLVENIGHCEPISKLIEAVFNSGTCS